MFRIERKYVTVVEGSDDKIVTVRKSEPAENEPADEPAPAPQPERPSGPTAEETAAKILESARASAAEILRQAQLQSVECVARAEDSAADVTARAEKEARQLRESARREGYAAGQTEVKEEYQSRRQQEEAQFRALLEQANRQRDELINGMADGIRGLVMEIARKVIRTKLDEEGVFAQMVENAIAEFRKEEDVTVRLNAADIEAYFGPGWSPEGRKGSVELIADENMARGDCALESETMAIDCGVEKQLDVIQDALEQPLE